MTKCPEAAWLGLNGAMHEFLMGDKTPLYETDIFEAGRGKKKDKAMWSQVPRTKEVFDIEEANK